MYRGIRNEMKRDRPTVGELESTSTDTTLVNAPSCPYTLLVNAYDHKNRPIAGDGLWERLNTH